MLPSPWHRRLSRLSQFVAHQANTPAYFISDFVVVVLLFFLFRFARSQEINKIFIPFYALWY